jgi:hypothetical protein
MRRNNTLLEAVVAGALGLGLTVLVLATVQGATSQGTTSRALGPGPSGSPGATPDPMAVQDPRNQPAPPGHLPPSAPARWPATTADQVIANIRTDAFVRGQLSELASPGAQFFDSSVARPPVLGTPAFVRTLVSTAPNVWLVPVLADTRVIGVIGIEVLPDGNGAASFYGQWAGNFPHALTPAEAVLRASATGDPATTVELVGANVSPPEGGPGGRFYPFYRAVRASGTAVYVFQGGNVVLAKDVHPY